MDRAPSTNHNNSKQPLVTRLISISEKEMDLIFPLIVFGLFFMRVRREREEEASE
ncbi:uncharacterized protein G2W53_013955 [Senna tora]|uniref:Uncharacterized protein n=1 Tax=Senna tora TaxID=362788 RepID=A0A834WR48_9FABA|nr:uncharacterized protein G2W53_013955 [Senna tora]